MGKLNEILLRGRVEREMMTSDISKMYNQLHLEDSALPYSLFLYHESMDEKVEPDTWVMTRAWYGVTSTGNQAGWAIEKTVEDKGEEYPLAAKTMKKGRYVDDLLVGTQNKKEMKELVEQCANLLDHPGFKLKYVVLSGEDPPKEASQDGETVKILGYNWTPKKDELALGMGEVNFNKKIRGSKKPNPFKINTAEDLKFMMNQVIFTKKTVASKVAEIFDPIGLWEPLKLQLKLDFSMLNGRTWESKLSESEKTQWMETFEKYIDLPTLRVSRCVIPEDACSLDLRLVALADAGEAAGGTVIYATYKRKNGEYSHSCLHQDQGC